MEIDKITENKAILTAQLIGIRLVVARLVAYHAAKSASGNPEDVFREYFDAADLHAFQIEQASGENPLSLKMQEELRKQVEWIVAHARRMLKEEEE